MPCPCGVYVCLCVHMCACVYKPKERANSCVWEVTAQNKNDTWKMARQFTPWTSSREAGVWTKMPPWERPCLLLLRQFAQLWGSNCFPQHLGQIHGAPKKQGADGLPYLHPSHSPPSWTTEFCKAQSIFLCEIRRLQLSGLSKHAQKQSQELQLFACNPSLLLLIHPPL
jgi:hypothetical protein